MSGLLSLFRQRLCKTIRKQHIETIKYDLRKQIHQNFKLENKCSFCQKYEPQKFNDENKYSINFHSIAIQFLELGLNSCSYHRNRLTQQISQVINKYPLLMKSYIKSTNANKLSTITIYLQLLSNKHEFQYKQLFQLQFCKNSITRDIFIQGPYASILSFSKPPKNGEAVGQKYYRQIILLVIHKYPIIYLYYCGYSNCLEQLLYLSKSRVNIAVLNGLTGVLELIFNQNSKVCQWMEQKIQVKKLGKKLQNIIIDLVLQRNIKNLTVEELQLSFIIINMLLIIPSIKISIQFFNRLIHWMKINDNSCIHQDLYSFYSSLMDRIISVSAYHPQNMDIQINQNY